MGKMMELKEITPDQVANPDEVAQVFEIVFHAINKILDDTDAMSGDIRREIRKEAADLKRAMNGAVKKGNASHQDLKKVVDSLVTWRKTEMKKETAEDAAEALELAQENRDSLAEIRTIVSEIDTKSRKRGKPGKIPAHEWDGTSIRFEQEDGNWGEWVDLRGEPGAGGGFSLFGGPEGLLINRITSNGSSGAATLSPDGTLNIPQYTGGAASTLSVEVPADAINDSNLNFVFSKKPLVIIMNQGTYRNDAVSGWSWNAGSLTATMPSVPGTGGDIYGLISS